MKISSQKANELGLNVSQLVGYKEFKIELNYNPGGGYTTDHLKSKLIQKINEEEGDFILVNFDYTFFKQTNSGGFYVILGKGDVYNV